MRAVAANLRLELVLARDQLPSAADAHSVQQRRRAAAYDAVLCAQPPGAPLRLAHQVRDPDPNPNPDPDPDPDPNPNPNPNPSPGAR